jgi:NAD(P)-dependent dehydrogenase (short-subunit alcohol dehydrogenase family)
MQHPSGKLTLHGNKVLITGGDRGIGLAAAEAYAKAGCNIVLNAFGAPDKAETEARRLAEAFGVSASSFPADVGDPLAARSMTRNAAERLGGLDIVVCNAGICHFKPILELTDEEWLRHLQTNLSGTFYVAQEAAKIMVAQGTGGRIIFTTSVGAFRSNGTQTHYCATKGGQSLLMQGMALELGPHGITVNAVAPGWIHTDINDAASRDPAVFEPWLRAHCPVGRLGGGKDVQGAYLFLASREAAYINGSTITIDGGWMAQL